MEIIGPKHFSKVLSINSMRDYILDNKITENDTLLLHPCTFDDIVLEYRETFGYAIPARYFLLGVLVEESIKIPVAEGRIVVLRNDDRPARFTSPTSILPVADDDRTIYRCGYCGDVINSSGSLLDIDEKNTMIAWLMGRHSNENVSTVNGACCPGGRVVRR